MLTLMQFSANSIHWLCNYWSISAVNGPKANGVFRVTGFAFGNYMYYKVVYTRKIQHVIISTI
jgi:hypothetical protein